MLEEREAVYLALYHKESDEQIYQRLRDIAAQLGRLPLKSEVPASYYFKTRLGNWPQILEKAGLKQVTENRRNKMVKRVQARKKSRQRE